MSEVIVTSWQHKTDPTGQGKWEAMFFQIEGIGKPLPLFTGRRRHPKTGEEYEITSEELRARLDILDKRTSPLKAEMWFHEGKKGVTIDDYEIIDGPMRIDTSVVAGKGADERPHSPPESEAATGLPPAAPPKATTPTPTEVPGFKEALAHSHPSLTDNLQALMERCYEDARLAAKREVKPDTPPEVRASIINDVGTTARTLFIERCRRTQK